MVCPQCDAELDDRQRFCRICGTAVATITGATTEPPTDESGESEPDESSESEPGDAVESSEASEDLVDDLVIVETTPAPGDTDITVPILYDFADDEPELFVDASPAHGGAPTDRVPVVDPIPLVDPADQSGAFPRRAQVGVVTIVGTLTGVVALVGMFPRVVAVRTDSTAPTFPTGDWLVADVGTNLPGALIVALVTLLIGVVGATLRQRWAYGLAGGSGLAIAGWSALTIGLVERPVRSALDAVDRPIGQAFSVTITRDVGYGLILAAGAGGVLTFFASLGRSGRDRRRSLNPWIAALGATAAVVAAAGPLLPEGGASLSDNWISSSADGGEPELFLAGRLIQLGLVAVTGIVGFLLVRRYGLGLAIGGMTVSAWLAITTLLELGGTPIGPGVANPGSGEPATLHSVTTAGMTALLALAIIAVIAAYDQAAREP